MRVSVGSKMGRASGAAQRALWGLWVRGNVSGVSWCGGTCPFDSLCLRRGVRWAGKQTRAAGAWAGGAVPPANGKPPSCLWPVFCRVYMPDHSYVTIRSRLSASVQDILGSVTEKLQYSEEPAGREDSLILVAVASSGGEAGEELGRVVVGAGEEKLASPVLQGRGTDEL